MSTPQAAADPPPPAGRRRIRRVLRGAAVAVLLWLLVSWGVAYRLTRRRHPAAEEVLPPSVAASYETLRLRTADGQNLGAWYAPGRDDAPSVLLLHGNGGSRWNCLARAELVREAGASVLLVSLRAHGDSSGEYNDVGFGARRDVIAAVDELRRRRPGRPLVVLGTSMGAAAALFAAGELGHRVDAYVLESPYRDLRTAVWNRVDDALPPGLNWLAYAGLLAVSPVVIPHLDRVSPCEAAVDVPADVPVLILAGSADRRARPDEARAVADRLKGHATLLVFEGAGHLLMMHADPPRYRRAVLDALAAAGRHAAGEIGSH